MTVNLSSEVMRAMGFRDFAEGESLTASFTSVTVYEARGVTLQPDATQIAVGVVGGVNYGIGMGTSLNETCVALTADAYVESEEEWKKEKGCTGPFVVVQLGPTPAYTINKGQLKAETDGTTTTFDSFPALRADLAALEAGAMPPVLSSITCALSQADRHLELRKLDRSSVGRTNDRNVVHDIRVQMSANAHVSHAIPPGTLATRLQEAIELAPRLNAKAARFFALGLGEDVELKKFLYFFLALEVETHAVFGRIDHDASLNKLLDHTAPLRSSAVALLQRQADQLRNLFDRFVWCSACVWSHIDDDDVDQFRKLKQARDDIAHGSAAEPPAGYARLAQRLGSKVLWRGP